MRVVFNILKWLFVMLAALVVIMLVINWSDQSPSPVVLKMQSLLREGSNVPDEENAFVYAMGFAASRESDPANTGMECISKFNAAVSKSAINFDSDLGCDDAASARYGDSIISAVLDTCGIANKDCEVVLQENEQAIAQWLQAEDWLLQRYSKLLQRSKWRMTAEYSIYMPFPRYGAIGDGRKMLMLKAWHLAGQGKAEEVRQLLSREARFWRMVLSSSSTLVGKMVAASFLDRDFAFANLVLRRLQAQGIKPAIPDAWLVPFSGDEMSLAKAMAGESEYLASILREEQAYRTILMDENNTSVSQESTVLDDWVENTLGHFLLRQATQNERAEMLARMVEMLHVPVKQFPQALRRLDAYQNDLASAGSLWHPYNPIGHALNIITLPAFSSDYAARVYDLEGVRQAVLAVTQLRESGVGVDQIDVALGQSELRSPYDDTPFVWDAGVRSIVFKGLGQGGQNAHSFLY